VLTRSFGHAEARLLMGRAFHFAQTFATPPATSETQEHQRRVPLQGVGKWDTVWEPLVDFAQSHELVKVNIDLNLAWLQEGYHASWQSVRLPEKALQLNVSVPLFTHRASDRTHTQIGRLEIVASGTNPDVYERIGELSDLLTDLGIEVDRIVSKLESSKQTPSEPYQVNESAVPDVDQPTSDTALSSSP
jgi:UDP-GlcNAc:undecaprenyl-phosphate GlcNAc-1-phosphate transferase